MSEHAGVSTGDDVQADAEALVADLERAATAFEEARKRVEDAGPDRLERLSEYYDEITTLLDRYEEQATSDGETDVDMAAFIEFQEKVGRFMDRLPEDIDHYDAFDAVDDQMHQKWVKQSDFEAARDALEPIADLVERLDERQRTLERFREARHDVAAREREVSQQIDDLESLLALGDADLDAPVEKLREPIEQYNRSVTEAFETFKRERSARDVLAFVETTATYPLVEYRQPPEDLATYVADSEAGTETVSTLLEYAEYSTSKLQHYVPDARELKRNVATHQTYLRRLDAEPLTVSWPPPNPDTLWWRCREVIPVVDQIAPDGTVTKLRAVRELPQSIDYERLRESVRARDQLDDSERKRLESGAVEAELRTLEPARTTLSEALEEYPER
ncbi:DUF7118 family protein [Halorhabdus salina]|uniref:DUF7118 family protein n=1 Tax=Halorhabdus salina TaxID=2750670 RepID=UPI0015EF07A2|nr:hypothetical protein [Halorhabdus salina]